MNVTILETRSVELPESEALRVAEKMVQRCCKLDGGTYIKSGKLCYEDRVGGGSHSWFETVEVRDATTLDECALAVLARLNKDYETVHS